ncbi:hypothetical protein [Sedimentitalea sp.]|uniref:hypothetical protein n=1 Tax=Sedimentitalea sp. TaxID=2048915 RepID=UPI003298AFF9
MDFEPISAARMVVLMIAGGVFAAVGLYLMLRPRSHGAAKIELFGLKFESSSAGLLVFLIGAAFLAITLFVPEKDKAVDGVGGSVPVPQPVPTAQPNLKEPDTEPSQPKSVQAMKEAEPNDTLQTPNILEVGQSVTGSFDSEDADWFAVYSPLSGLTGYEVMLRHISGSHTRVDVYNNRGEFTGYVESKNGAQYLKLTSDYPEVVYLEVYQRYVGGARYELAVLPPS